MRQTFALGAEKGAGHCDVVQGHFITGHCWSFFNFFIYSLETGYVV